MFLMSKASMIIICDSIKRFVFYNLMQKNIKHIKLSQTPISNLRFSNLLKQSQNLISIHISLENTKQNRKFETNLRSINAASRSKLKILEIHSECGADMDTSFLENILSMTTTQPIIISLRKIFSTNIALIPYLLSKSENLERLSSLKNFEISVQTPTRIMSFDLMCTIFHNIKQTIWLSLENLQIDIGSGPVSKNFTKLLFSLNCRKTLEFLNLSIYSSEPIEIIELTLDFAKKCERVKKILLKVNSEGFDQSLTHVQQPKKVNNFCWHFDCALQAFLFELY